MKIMIAVDLDDTHFFSRRNGIHWIGDKTARIQFYINLIKAAEAKGIEVVFVVLTAKKEFDDICLEAASAFKPLLSRHNKDMYVNFDGLEYVLVNHNTELYYQCLATNIQKKLENPARSLHSHFHIVSRPEYKIGSLVSIGRKHDIPSERTIFLDDIESILVTARKRGMKTVSFWCFNERNPNQCLGDDEAVVNQHLEQINKTMLTIFDEVCEHCLAERDMRVDENSDKRLCM